MLNTQTESSPLGVMDSLSTGFSMVAQRLDLLLVPLLVDLFLWLGPRLSARSIVPEFGARLRSALGEPVDSSVIIFERNVAEILGSYNLFSALSTWPLGVPSLLAGKELDGNPLGMPATIYVKGIAPILLFLGSLFLIGMLIGSFYLGLVARQVVSDEIRSWIRMFGRHWARVMTFVLATLLCILVLNVPFFLILSALSAASLLVAALFSLVGVGIGAWCVFHLLFVIHGVLLYDWSLEQAVRSSVVLVHRCRFSAVGLLATVVLIHLGLSSIWNIPPLDSWLRLISITGSAFINTGLVMSTFVYYHERVNVYGDKLQIGK